MKDINLVRKMAWSFNKTTGIPFEELLSEATIGYLEAVQSHDPTRGKLSTHAWTVMKCRLIDFTNKELYPRERTTNELEYRALYGGQTNTIAGEGTDEDASASTKYAWEAIGTFGPQQDADQERTLIFKEAMDNLSDEAKTVCQVIFQSPHEFMTGAPKLSRGKVKNKLRQLGWSWSMIWNSFREIKATLNETAQ